MGQSLQRALTVWLTLAMAGGSVWAQAADEETPAAAADEEAPASTTDDDTPAPRPGEGDEPPESESDAGDDSEAPPPRKNPPGRTVGPRAPDTYQGVTPDAPGPEFKGAIPKKPTVTWVGFLARRGGEGKLLGGQVFVQMSHPVVSTQTVKGDELIVFLPGVALKAKGAQRPMILEYFSSEVATLRTLKGRFGRVKGVELRIKFKAAPARTLAERSSPGKDGMQYLYFDVP